MMELFELLDRIICHLYELRRTDTELISPYELARALGVHRNKTERALAQLYDDKLVIFKSKETTQLRTVSKFEVFALHYNGIALLLLCPEKYINKPYQWFIKKNDDKDAEEKIAKQLVKDTNQALKNSSISAVTTNCLMRWFTGILAIAAVFTLIVQSLQLNIMREELQKKTEAPRIQVTIPIQPVLLRDTSFSVKDKERAKMPTRGNPK